MQPQLEKIIKDLQYLDSIHENELARAEREIARRINIESTLRGLLKETEAYLEQFPITRGVGGGDVLLEKIQTALYT